MFVFLILVLSVKMQGKEGFARPMPPALLKKERCATPDTKLTCRLEVLWGGGWDFQFGNAFVVAAPGCLKKTCHDTSLPAQSVLSWIMYLVHWGSA